MFRRSRLLLLVPMVFTVFANSVAQTSESPAQSTIPDAPKPKPKAEEVTVRGTPLAVLKDQLTIWTSPARIRSRDLLWLAPLAAATGAALATDHRAMSSLVPREHNFNNASTDTSNILIGTAIAAPVALFGVGEFKHDPHARETGILGGEAMVDSVILEQGMKLIFWRERPAANNARGNFFEGGAGVDSSFPSAHSLISWSSAAVIAGEYPSRRVQFAAYSLATGVSVTRVLGQQHFPSDVLVGSAAGWLIGRYVYRSHHRHRLHY